jgi:hypothetical protein
MHGDLYSVQARKFMEILRPVVQSLPESKKPGCALQELLEWNLMYDAGSKGAVIFEEFYDALLRDIYGRVSQYSAAQVVCTITDTLLAHVQIYSPEATTKVMLRIGAFFHYMDNVIFDYDKEDDWLWKGETREQFFKR